MITFRQFLCESHDMLDISILAADKYLTSQTKFNDFLNNEVSIEAKSDGVKLTVYKKADNGDINDWIFAYKNIILYPGEYDWQPDTKVNKESVGASQFKKVFDHFEKIGKTSIPVGTELQCEFLMRKSTLSSNYEKPHGIILIQYAKSKYNEEQAKFGVLKTQPITFGTAKREEYAKELKLNTPLVLFRGVLGNPRTFASSILNDTLKSEFSKRKNIIDFTADPQNLYNELKDLFLSVPSAFGGKEEGVVLKFNNGLILKWQQSYQVDQDARKLIKMKYQEDDPEKESQYWINVKNAAFNLVNSVLNNLKFGFKFEDALKELSNQLKRFRVNFTHSKKTDANIKDDIDINAKNLLKKKIKGNNGCLVLGKFRVFTNGHLKVLQNAVREFDKVCLCLVTSKDTKDTEEFRMKILEEVVNVYGKDKVSIIRASNGNLLRIINDKSPFNINSVYCGTDRVQGYLRQLEKMIGMSVKEVKRSDKDISASKVIANISDEKYFEDNVPKILHKYYRKYVDLYKING